LQRLRGHDPILTVADEFWGGATPYTTMATDIGVDANRLPAALSMGFCAVVLGVVMTFAVPTRAAFLEARKRLS
jgi:hypothetical protein